MYLSRFMKTISNILKLIFLQVMFIGAAHSATSCPAISIEKNYNSPANQAEAIIGNTICALIELKQQDNYEHDNVLSLVKKRVLPFINVEYTTQQVLNDHWQGLTPDQKQTFVNNLTKSLEDYVGTLVNYDEFEDIYFEVDKNNIIFKGNKSEVVIYTSPGENRKKTAITLKLIHTDPRWQIYDLVYQGISILYIERMSYNSKIQRYGLDGLLQKIQ